MAGARVALARRLGRARAWFAREDGVASVEFVLVLPVLFVLFLSSVEAGFLQLRYVMLERGLDMTVRELRLGEISSPTHDKVKDEICRLATVIPDCVNSLMVELKPVDTSTWTGLDASATCIDRSEPIATQQPPNFDPGTDDDLMIIRACAVFDPLFPTTGLGLQLTKDATGAYKLVAASAFVNEPS
ncbi:TadE/TadG family type IV pilus assembly protein [Acidimangrovimonas sediminis]|uniref:TadE/TadG family type IV pilus assembly protein n=1 Tax=Acidimangrovimonas sediminis TaxID=2056283 RepID=UPI001E2A238B|nr:TadE/TadG family type IV pilus assembly protein [Acidimangrovimonas sediminis]